MVIGIWSLVIISYVPERLYNPPGEGLVARLKNRTIALRLIKPHAIALRLMRVAASLLCVA